MKRYEFANMAEVADHGIPMFEWMIDTFGESHYWRYSFQPQWIPKKVNWYIGVRRDWFTPDIKICMWMRDEAYTAFLLRFV